MRIGTLSTMAALLAISTAAAQTPPSGRPSGSPNGAATTTPNGTATFVTEGEVPGAWTDTPGMDDAAMIGQDPAAVYNRWYGKGEYLLWKIRNSSLPQLQLTVPFVATGLDQLQTNVFVPGGDVDHAARSGGRATLGYWVDLDHYLGFEVSYFQLENRQDPFFVNQFQNIPLTVTIQQNIQVQNVSGGAVTITQEQQPLDIILPAQLTVTTNGQVGPTHFYGGEISARSTRAYFGAASFDLLGGFRYINLDESFAFNETIQMQTANPSTITTQGLVPTNPATGQLILPPIPTQISGLQTLFTTISNNSVSTQNRFYGVNFGSSFEWYLSPRIFMNGFGKVAIGGVTQRALMANFTSTSSNAAGGVVGIPGGTLSPVVASLSHSRTRYAFAPEFNVNLGCQLTSQLRATIGYNFLYITSVVRPGDQIIFSDSSSAITIAGTANSVPISQPTFQYNDADFYAQGLVAGLEFKY